MKYIHWIEPTDKNDQPRLKNHGQPDGARFLFRYTTGQMRKDTWCICHVNHTVAEYNEAFHQWAKRNMSGIDENISKEELLEFQKYMDPHYTTEIKGKQK